MALAVAFIAFVAFVWASPSELTKILLAGVWVVMAIWIVVEIVPMIWHGIGIALSTPIG